jgi:hypothetical protein
VHHGARGTLLSSDFEVRRKTDSFEMFDSSIQLSQMWPVWFFLILSYYSKGCFFKFGVEVGVEEPIVNSERTTGLQL